MGFSYALKTLAFVCALAWTSSYKELDTLNYTRYKLDTMGIDYFSSEDMPISLSKRGVITDNWFTYIDELVSKFGNGNNMHEVLSYLHLNVKRAFYWCKPNRLPNYILDVKFAKVQMDRDLTKYQRIPCGKVIFSKLSTDQYRPYVHFIVLAKKNPSASVTYGLNLTIHSFMSSEHKQYLTGDMTETMCKYVTLAIVYQYETPRMRKSSTYYWCGEIIRKRCKYTCHINK